jgi:hypothetical protein
VPQYPVAPWQVPTPYPTYPQPNRIWCSTAPGESGFVEMDNVVQFDAAARQASRDAHPSNG